jgi:aspartokinase
MSEKISCGGLMERSEMCLVEVLGFSLREGETCGILGKFGRAGISLFYLSIGSGAKGDRNMSFCVRTAEMARHRGLLEEIEQEFRPRRIAANAPVVILTLYGPHFLERHNLAAEVFAALCSEDINAHTVGSSVNSISVVVDLPDRDRAVACLRERFDWPE